MDYFDRKEKNVRRIEAYYKKEALSNKRADLFSKIFLVVLIAGIIVYFFSSSLIAMLHHSDRELVITRIAHMHVFLLGLTIPFIKGSRRQLIFFFAVFALLLPNSYYGYYAYISGITLKKIHYFFFPILINLFSLGLGAFLLKKNSYFASKKRRKSIIR